MVILQNIPYLKITLLYIVYEYSNIYTESLTSGRRITFAKVEGAKQKPVQTYK